MGTYNWYIRRDDDPGFQLIETTTDPTLIVSIQDAYGAAYTSSDLNSNFYLGYNPGSSCATESLGQYSFSIVPLLIGTVSKGDISCYNASDGSITVTSFNRSFVSGESLKNLHLYTQPDLDVTHYVTTSNTNTISDISPGTYYILAESSVIPCDEQLNFYGPVIFTNPDSVTFTNPSTTPPSCHVNTTGTKNNGSITINPDGGTYSNYEYSINGSAYQIAGADPFTISNLTEGSYAINVRDGNGCESTLQNIVVSQPADITLTSALV